MDSKPPIPPSSNDNDNDKSPPSYTESISTNTTSPLNSFTSQPYSTQIQFQLRSLATQITSLQTQKSLLSRAKDEKILSLLTTQIQIYLSDFAQTGLRKGTLVLVPAAGRA